MLCILLPLFFRPGLLAVAALLRQYFNCNLDVHLRTLTEYSCF